MPRLFPSLGRSSRENARDGYEFHEGYEPGYGQYVYDERGHDPVPRAPSAWRRVLSKKSRTGGRAYYGEGEVPGFQRSRPYRTTVEDYSESQHGMTYAPSDDTESFVHISRHNSPVPIVQRESSLSRLQDAFADHGTYSPATMEAMTPIRGTPRYIPGQVPTAIPLEMSSVHEARQGPVMVNNVAMEGIRPEVQTINHHRRRERAHREYRNHPTPREPPPAMWETYPEDDDYPPVVVAVQHGGYGEKDTYYIIPGGAPVIFEDEDGNEITRVGDFSGNYKPRRPRPVIVQDEYGREICRSGFDNDHSSGRTRPDDSFYPSSRRSHSHHEPRYDRDHGTPYMSEYPSRMYDDFDDGRHHRSKHSYEGREDDSSPNVVFIDPSDRSWSSSGRRSVDTASRSSPRPNRDDDRYHDAQPRSYESRGSPSFIDLDHHRRERSSGSSRSGGSSSYRGHHSYR